LGFIVTPIFSIIFTKLFSESAPIIVSAILCVIPVFVLERLLDRQSYEEVEAGLFRTGNLMRKTKFQHQPEVGEGSGNHMSVTNIVRILNKPGVLNVMLKKNAPIVPMLLIFSIMQLYLIDQFNADAQTGQLIQMMTGKLPYALGSKVSTKPIPYFVFV
ncbi:unnamed protein product, partial [Strongylus vulgaris]